MVQIYDTKGCGLQKKANSHWSLPVSVAALPEAGRQIKTELRKRITLLLITTGRTLGPTKNVQDLHTKGLGLFVLARFNRKQFLTFCFFSTDLDLTPRAR